MTTLNWPRKPARRKTELGTARTWAAPLFKITQLTSPTGYRFPFVVWRYLPDSNGILAAGFYPINREYLSLSAAMRTANALASGRTLQQLDADAETRRQKARARRLARQTTT